MAPDKDKAALRLSNFCLTPNACGIGWDCSPCYSKLCEAQAKRIEELAANAAFYKSCALSGEIPSPGAEPYPPTDSDTSEVN